MSREKRRHFTRLTRRVLYLQRDIASHLFKALHQLGVCAIYLDYPFNIAQNRATCSRQICGLAVN